MLPSQESGEVPWPPEPMEEEAQSVRGRGWVKFDGEEEHDSGKGNSESPGSLEVTDSHSVDVETLRRKSVESPARSSSGRGTVSSSSSVVGLSQVSLAEPRTSGAGQQFENGDVIVTLLPVNERFPWVTPARFRPELVPEELMAPSLSLTVEEYVSCLEKLTTDMRFTLYNILYKRILVIWIFSAFMVLIGILFSRQQGLTLFGLGVAWLICNALAIFLCMWVKLKLNMSLERCLAMVNASLIKHNLLVALDDRGKISCHKVNLCFLYFNPRDCVSQLGKVLAEKPEEGATNGQVFDREAYLRDEEGFDEVEVVVAGRNSVKVGGKGERAEKLFLHYAQRWAKDYLRRRLDWVVEDRYGEQDYSSNTSPRHLKGALCPCQYIEEHLKNKRQRESLNPCANTTNPCRWCD